MATVQRSLPPYDICESPRAKHVSIKISPLGEVKVVVPLGFNRRDLPPLLDQRRAWILKTVDRLQARRAELPPEMMTEQPAQLDLRSRQELWQINYQSVSQPALTLVQSAPRTLTIQGEVDHPQDYHDLLRQWLTRKAQVELQPWLTQISQEVALPFEHMSVRGQKSRWGSCSRDRNISLNYKLLFLPADLVHYVLVHELCHTIHMNHSKHFWDLVRQKLPHFERSQAELKNAWRYVPTWLESG